MVVRFWSFYKRENSTATPATDPAFTLDCKLKDASGILRPVLEVYRSSDFTPTSYNYAYIPIYNRYYRVVDWQWIVGRWEVTLTVDVLASFKTIIGLSQKFVLRAASRYNRDVIDTFYPALGVRPTPIYSTAQFAFTRNYNTGTYILGVANRNANGAGAVSYFVMSSAQIRALVQYMIPNAAEAWTDPITGLTDTLYRALYGPFDYIKSCVWFPISIQNPGTEIAIAFGNYNSDVVAAPLEMNASLWGSESHTISLPANWLTRDAREKCSPYTRMYLTFNPWGTIELNPLDFSGATGINLTVTFDFISGDAMLKVYAFDGTVNHFIAQYVARIGIDINLSAASVNASGIISGVSTAVGAAALVEAGVATPAVAALSAAGGFTDAAISSISTASGSVGQNAGGAAFYDGVATLSIFQTEFPGVDIAEFGRPLMEKVQLNTLSGYIKCADGDINAECFNDELSMISDFLKSGFFYE